MQSLLMGYTYKNLTVPAKTIPPPLARWYAGGKGKGKGKVVPVLN
jgi:hypothetical protein